MGKTSQLEEDLAAHFESLVEKGVSSEVGLLVGQFGSSARDLVFGVAPCPPRNNARSAIVCIANFAPNAAKGKKGAFKPSLTVRLDVDWITEHGVQVERMLPGGLQVVGLYVFVQEVGYHTAVGEICSVLKELQDAGVCKSSQEMLVLHVDEGAKRYVMRSCPAGATSAADLKPSEIKYGPGLKNLVCLRTVYHIDFWLPASSDVDSLQQHFEEVIASETRNISACHVLHEGRFPDPSALLTDMVPKDATAAEPVELQLFRPLDATSAPVASTVSSTSVIGRGRIQGTLEGRVYCNKRSNFEKSALELKEDLCRSLRARLDLLVEDAEKWTEQKAEDYDTPEEAPKHSLFNKSQLASHIHYNLPFRVFIPWKAGVMLCDYLMPGETLENTQARVKDMLAIEDVDAEEVATAERLDDAPAARSGKPSAGDVSWSKKTWDPYALDVQVAATAPWSRNMTLIAYILVALLSALLVAFQLAK